MSKHQELMDIKATIDGLREEAEGYEPIMTEGQWSAWKKGMVEPLHGMMDFIEDLERRAEEQGL